DEEAEVLGEEADGTIHNVSAGGILMATNDPPQAKEYIIIKPVKVNWPLPGAIAGKIMWRRSQPPEQKFNTHIGVDFRDPEEFASGWSKEHKEKLPGNIVMLSQNTRHRLMQFVYLRQIELRNKGLI
ncbi:MAG: PilZ domain-containing protein, partial [Planctomycetes bacterium]|nr:PilZ domain-containing protein [Planctomycetota bacterium]